MKPYKALFEKTDAVVEEYYNWVEKEGHITRSASSVLIAFIKEKNYGQKEADIIMDDMKWTDEDRQGVTIK